MRSVYCVLMGVVICLYACSCRASDGGDGDRSGALPQERADCAPYRGLQLGATHIADALELFGVAERAFYIREGSVVEGREQESGIIVLVVRTRHPTLQEVDVEWSLGFDRNTSLLISAAADVAAATEQGISPVSRTEFRVLMGAPDVTRSLCLDQSLEAGPEPALRACGGERAEYEAWGYRAECLEVLFDLREDGEGAMFDFLYIGVDGWYTK